MATKKDPKDEAFGKAPEPESHPPIEQKPAVAVVPESRGADRPLSWGERACGVGFNPGGDPKVATIKAQFAAVVDTLHNLRESAVDGEGVIMQESHKEEREWIAPADPWKHRSSGMRCQTCIWFVPKMSERVVSLKAETRVVGRCRRHAPTMGGYPVVFQTDWCGDHRLDENKV